MALKESNSFSILVDADSCPVRQEVHRVAHRYGLKVVLIANKTINSPPEQRVELVLVGNHLDAADDWIIENVDRNDIVVTTDIPLASRSVKKGARVVTPRGIIYTERSIGDALASRDLLTHLRDAGLYNGGPPSFEKKDRSRFLQALDTLVRAVQNGK